MTVLVQVDEGLVIEFREAFAELTRQQSRHKEQARADASRYVPYDVEAGSACERYAAAASALAKSVAGV